MRKDVEKKLLGEDLREYESQTIKMFTGNKDKGALYEGKDSMECWEYSKRYCSLQWAKMTMNKMT